MGLIFKIIIIILLIKCFNKIEGFVENIIDKTKKITGLNKTKRNKKIKVIWFHTETCPHCVNMSSSWHHLVKMYKNDPIKNKLFELVKIDVSKTKYADMLKYYDSRIKSNHCMEGVPNVVMFDINDNDHIYTGDRSETDMDTWIRLTSNI